MVLEVNKYTVMGPNGSDTTSNRARWLHSSNSWPDIPEGTGTQVTNFLLVFDLRVHMLHLFRKNISSKLQHGLYKQYQTVSFE